MSGNGSGSEDTSDYEGDSASESEEEQAERQRGPASKRRRVDGGDGLGLELVTEAVLHGGGMAAAAEVASHIDGSEEAEASLLQLEVADLLREARPEPGLEAGLLELLSQLAALLRALPEAEVAPKEAAAIGGFLSDLAFTPVVRWGSATHAVCGAGAHEGVCCACAMH